MATIDQLEAAGVLHRIMRSEYPSVRKIYMLDVVKPWFDTSLPSLRASHDELVRPLLQARNLFRDFIHGYQMNEGDDFWRMRPLNDDVYELKTSDLRFFGWFAAEKMFIVSSADTAENCHRLGLHPAYRDEVKRRRDNIDLDEPKWVLGAEPVHVF